MSETYRVYRTTPDGVREFRGEFGTLDAALASVTCDLTAARKIAAEIVRSHDAGLAPCLADALEESGAEFSTADLAALRSGKPRHDVLGRILADVLGIRIDIETEDDRNPRRRTRRVDADDLAHRVAWRAIVQGRAYAVDHGGTVANAYSYPAVTDGVLAIARLEGDRVRCAVLAGELPAKKVTAAGVAALWGHRQAFDERYSESNRKAAVEAMFTDLLRDEDSASE